MIYYFDEWEINLPYPFWHLGLLESLPRPKQTGFWAWKQGYWHGPFEKYEEAFAVTDGRIEHCPNRQDCFTPEGWLRHDYEDKKRGAKKVVVFSDTPFLSVI